MKISNAIESPWRVIAHGGSMYQIESHTHTEVIAECSEHSDATARLVSVATELYVALASLVVLIDAGAETSEAVKFAHDVILKASGVEE